MNLKRTVLTFGIAVLALGASAAGAFAATAFATGNVNVREGPGTRYDVIGTLRRGERVDVDYCRGTWCLTDEGWVSANYLTRDRFYDDDFYDDDYFFIDRPSHRRHFRRHNNRFDGFASFCVGNVNARFCVTGH